MPGLPPLNALRAFEVAARAGSFVSAGAELGVSAAAVSLQVKNLEAHLGRQLFLRQGNRITMTDAARAIYPRLEQALTDISALTRQVRAGTARARYVISVLPSLAETWLIPALARFAGPTGIEIRAEEDPVPFTQDGADLRLTYGAVLYPDFRVETLFADRMVPVAASPLLASAGDLTALADSAFVHTDWGPAFATLPGWRDYFARAGSDRAPDPGAGLRVRQSGHAVAAARAGLGAALVPSRLAAADLAAGRLVPAGPLALDLPFDFVMIHSHALGRRAPFRALLAHLRDAAGVMGR